MSFLEVAINLLMPKHLAKESLYVMSQSSKCLSNETTLVLSNTRELDRVPSTKYSTLYTNSHGPC